MNGQMRRYKESLAKMSDPVLLSQCPKVRLDLRGLMRYAKEKGVKVTDLTEKEKAVFIKD
jgi:hypothetical protein